MSGHPRAGRSVSQLSGKLMLTEDPAYQKWADVHNWVITSEELTGFGDYWGFLLFFSPPA